MRLVRGAEEARRTLLRRAAMDEPELPAPVRETIRRVFGAELDAAAVVDRILRDVRSDGDAAVRFYDQQIDGVRGERPLEVSRDEINAAYRDVDASLVEALKLAADRIELYHQTQLQHSARSFEESGLGQIVRPIERVGLYIPGNKVIYPSTLLMTAIPARVAGVTEIIVVTPSLENGTVAPLKLVAADIAGASRVFRGGGVQGIAAMAYGTASVPKVDKICGPGNIFVTLAKKRLFGEVGIDGIFGPSETLVVADGSADARLVAADVLAGAEHDELATAILLTDDEKLAEEVGEIVDGEIGDLDRADAARTSLEARGGAIVCESIEEAIDLANDFAAEHVCLHLARHGSLGRPHPECRLRLRRRVLRRVGRRLHRRAEPRDAHRRQRRFSSALGVHDFLKVTSLVRLDRETVREIGPAGVAIGYAEGLTGHARAIESRLK